MDGSGSGRHLASPDWCGLETFRNPRQGRQFLRKSQSHTRREAGSESPGILPQDRRTASSDTRNRILLGFTQSEKRNSHSPLRQENEKTALKVRCHRLDRLCIGLGIHLGQRILVHLAGHLHRDHPDPRRCHAIQIVVGLRHQRQLRLGAHRRLVQGSGRQRQ